MITGAPDCIYKTIILITMLFLKKTNPNFHEIYQISGALLALDIGYWIQCYKEAHPLLLDYFITFLRYIEMIL